MSVLDKVSKEVQREIAVEAIKASLELGYCSEAQRVLEHMGFDLPNEKKTVTLTFEVELPLGVDLDPDACEVYAYDTEGEHYDCYGVQITRVD